MGTWNGFIWYPSIRKRSERFLANCEVSHVNPGQHSTQVFYVAIAHNPQKSHVWLVTYIEILTALKTLLRRRRGARALGFTFTRSRNLFVPPSVRVGEVNLRPFQSMSSGTLTTKSNIGAKQPRKGKRLNAT